MASGQTQYYGLSQWEAVDKVERVDFNSDNAKIDGALHQLAQCNCRMYFTSYTGTGGDGQSLVFPQKPLLVIGMGGVVTWWCGVQGVPFLYLRQSGSASGMPAAVWEGNTLSWSRFADSDSLSGNELGKNYTVVAFLEVGS